VNSQAAGTPTGQRMCHKSTPLSERTLLQWRAVGTMNQKKWSMMARDSMRVHEGVQRIPGEPEVFCQEQPLLPQTQATAPPAADGTSWTLGIAPRKQGDKQNVSVRRKAFSND
jgi:hypothetical protein